MGVPLYRQEKIWDDRGLILPRNMMANWCIKSSQYYLEPIYNLMLNQMKENSEVLHCDESTIQCNKEQGKKHQVIHICGLLHQENQKKRKV